MNEQTCHELMDMKNRALDKIMKAELIFTEISTRYGQAEEMNVFAARNILQNYLGNGISPEGTKKQLCDWALDYDLINQKLEIVFDYIVACRMLLETGSENQI
ncbi:MAG: hypothetical protein ACYC5K_09060 [Saccharofermentanales bacterium]